MSRRLVEIYSQDMRADAWSITHQGVAFDVDEVLLDGQKRLQAILVSRIPQWLLVTWGLSRESMDMIDRAQRRVLAHSYQIENSPFDTRRFCAVARSMMLGGWNSDMGVSDAMLRAFCNRHQEEILFAISVCPDRTAPASVAAVLARAIPWSDQDEIAHFMAAYTDSIPAPELKPRDRSARTLRNYLIRMRHSGGNTARQEIFRKTISAVKAFLEGRELTKLVEAEKDWFPLRDDDEEPAP